MRITYNYLKDWYNEQMKLRKSKTECVEVYRTTYSNNEYENGAAQLIFCIVWKNKKDEYRDYIFCFYSLANIKAYLANGYELFLKDAKYESQEVDLRRK